MGDTKRNMKQSNYSQVEQTNTCKQINELMILEHCDECKGNEMRRMRRAQGKPTGPKSWEALGMIREGFMEEVTIELNFNGVSDLKGERPSKYIK